MDLDGVLEVVAAVLILVGSALALVAAIGLFRMPDAYSRIHVATKPATSSLVTSHSSSCRIPGVSTR